MQVAIAIAREAVALPRVDCDAPASINRVSRLQLWHIAPFHGTQNFGRLRTQAGIHSPFPSRIYEFAAKRKLVQSANSVGNDQTGDQPAAAMIAASREMAALNEFDH
jgi:hypothetical protein